MIMAWDFDGLLNIPITVAPYLGTDDMLDAVYDDPIDAVCYIDETIEKIIDREGTETLSNISFFINTVYHAASGPLSVRITENDLITFGGKTYRIKSLNTIRDLYGDPALWVVYA